MQVNYRILLFVFTNSNLYKQKLVLLKKEKALEILSSNKFSCMYIFYETENQVEKV